MRALTPAQVLQVWESGSGRHPVVRAVVLAAVGVGHTFAEVSDLPLGARDALLVDVRVACFGEDLECLVRCPACAEELEVAVPATDLRRPAPTHQRTSLDAGGTRVRLRALTSRDVLSLDPAAGDARRRLVSRCVLEVDGAPAEGAELTDDIIAAVAAVLPEVDPQADVRLDLTCAVCGHAWSAPFDVPAHVWADLDACARGLLTDVHTLASAYGWYEDDVLALGPARRRFYLDAVGT